jgi:hypothetical protein
MSYADVQIVVAVHDLRRQVGRAVASVLQSAPPRTEVLVVAHDLAPECVESLVPERLRPAVRVIEHRDGIRSPSGTFNAGLAAARADYVGLLGSDDSYQPGAVASWLAIGRRANADAVLARVEYSAGALVRTPPARPLRRHRLDLVKDRLSYRSAPLGLVRRAAIDELGLGFTPGLATGEDLAFTVRLWSGGRTLELARRSPAYVIGDDAPLRVTFTARTVSDELACVLDVLDQPWFPQLPVTARRSVCTKMLRIHVFGAVYHRRDGVTWPDEDREALALVAGRLVDEVPTLVRALSSADRTLLALVRDARSPASALTRAGVDRRRHGRPSTVVTPDVRGLLAVDGPLRTMVASALW